MTNLNHNNRTLVTTNLRHAKTVTVEGVTLNVPENCPTVAVQRRLDGKWYVGAENRSACSESLVGAVQELFGLTSHT